MSDPNKECPHCGNIHKTKCPMVKAIEYFENGMVKRIEFMTPGDYAMPMPTLPALPSYPSPNPPPWPITYGGAANDFVPKAGWGV